MKDWTNKAHFHQVPWNVSNDHHTDVARRDRKYMDANKLRTALKNTANWTQRINQGMFFLVSLKFLSLQKSNLKDHNV